MADDRLPRLVIDAGEPGEDDLLALLSRAQRLILKYPFAAQAIFSAFVAEGRRFAETPEGSALRDELARSELVERCRVVFQFVTHNVLEERPSPGLPSAILDAFVEAARTADLESLLRRFLGRRP